MALTSCVRDMLYLHQVLDPVVSVPLPMTVYCDNLGTCQLVTNGNKTSRSKHVDIKYFFIHEKIKNGVLSVEHVSSKDNCADIFTKAPKVLGTPP